MIDYMCSYSRKSWKASVVFVEKAASYTMLNIRSELFESMNVFLCHKNEEYWLAIPESEVSCSLAYPTDTFWNFESIARCLKNKYVAKTIACGITEYYKEKDN